MKRLLISVVILVFGDHQPCLEMDGYALRENLSPLQRELARYMMPYLIWANYPIETGAGRDVSVNYLAPLLLQTAGMKMTDYDRWLLETAEEYPVTVLPGYADADGVFTPWPGEDRPERLVQLDHLRYNRLYDAQHRLPGHE